MVNVIQLLKIRSLYVKLHFFYYLLRYFRPYGLFTQRNVNYFANKAYMSIQSKSINTRTNSFINTFFQIVLFIKSSSPSSCRHVMERDSFLAFWTFLLLVNQQDLQGDQQELQGEAHARCPASVFLPPLQPWSAAKSQQRHDTHQEQACHQTLYPRQTHQVVYIIVFHAV